MVTEAAARQTVSMPGSAPANTPASTPDRTPDRTKALLCVSQALATVTIAIGACGIAGWAFGWPSLRRLLPDVVDLELSSAMAAALCGTATLLRDRGRWLRVASFALAAAALAIAAAVLLQYGGARGGLAQLAQRSPGAMAGGIAFFYLLSAMCLLMPDRAHWVAVEQRIAALLALFTLASFSAALARYTVAEKPAPGATGLNAVAVLAALSMALLLSRPKHGLVALLHSPRLGGAMARRVVFAFLLLFVGLPWIRVFGTVAKLYGATAAPAIVTVVGTLLLLATLYWCCQALELADARRSAAEEEVARSEQRFRCLIEATAEIVWVANAQGEITGPVPGWCRLTGLSQAELQGSGWLQALHPDDRARVAVAWQQAVASCGRYETEYRIRRRDGTYGDFVVRGVPIVDAAERVEEWVGSCTDISERKAVERMKDELVATVSHELRTPLASLRGFAELMLAREFPEAKRQEFLQIIYSESCRLAGLIDNFLDLQRIEAGRQTYNFTAVEVAPLLAEALRLHSGQATHTLEVEAPDDGACVLADRDRLRQVLTNLLANAIKYSPDGGRVLLSARRRGAEILFAVRDNGIGIPLDDQERLFTKFFRAHNSVQRKIGGTGLGLALVRQIIEGHRGRIWVESAAGQGATFLFTLPVATASLAAPSHRSSADGAYVLVVEDDLAFAELLREQLADLGHRVVQTAVAEQALEIARRSPPSMVLVDVLLPGSMDGWDLLVALKRESRLERVPVVMITITGPNAQGLALAGAEYILKSAAPEVLRQSIRRRLLALSGRRVLVVDDDPKFRGSLREFLQAEHAHVEEAGNGEQALRALAQHPPDLLVLDLLMPGMDGFELLRRLRNNRQNLHLPVLAVTGKELSDAEKAYLSRRLATLIDKRQTSMEQMASALGHTLQRAAVPAMH
jgi:PAS domain S-box-containing protein